MPDTVTIQTTTDVVTIAGGNETQSVVVTGNTTVEVLTVGVQGPQGASYTLPIATNGTLGGVIVGGNLTISGNGVLSSTAGMPEIASVTYGVSQIPNILGGNNTRHVAGMRANTTTVGIGNYTILKESYSGLAYNSTTGVAVGHIAGFTDTYNDPSYLLRKQQFEVRASTLSYLALNQANQVAFSAGFSVQASGGAKLFFVNNIDDISTDMQVDSEGVTIFTNGIVTVNGDEVLTLLVANSLFAPLTFKEEE